MAKEIQMREQIINRYIEETKIKYEDIKEKYEYTQRQLLDLKK